MGLFKNPIADGAVCQLSFRKEWDWLHGLWEREGLVKIPSGDGGIGHTFRAELP